MKFLNFFKSTAGIIIIILVVLALILVFMNWDSIKAWWNTPSVPNNAVNPSGAQGRFAGSGGASARGICVNYGGGNCSYYGISVPCSECTKRGITIS